MKVNDILKGVGIFLSLGAVLFAIFMSIYIQNKKSKLEQIAFKKELTMKKSLYLVINSNNYVSGIVYSSSNNVYVTESKEDVAKILSARSANYQPRIFKLDSLTEIIDCNLDLIEENQ